MQSMNTMRLSALKPEYDNLWNSCQIRPEWLERTKKVVLNIQAKRDRYESVASATNIPWYFIGCIHNMEASLNFNSHLHNGDSLKARTHREPKDRPLNPPKNGWDIGYSWEESAADALIMQKFHTAQDWSIPAQLWRLELYNGFGYRQHHPDVLTPYLWSGTHHYTKGKYVADNKWSAVAISEQVGAAAILKLLLPEIK
jgi:lysozyme family protein